MKVKQQINALFHKFVNRETVSYVVVGVFTTVIDLVLFWICSLFYSEGNMLGVTIGKIVAWIGAVAFAFFASKFVVFRSHDKSAGIFLREAVSFTASRLFSLLFAMVFIWLTVRLAGMDENVSNILSNIFVIIINYITSKLVVFRKK